MTSEETSDQEMSQQGLEEWMQNIFQAGYRQGIRDSIENVRKTATAMYGKVDLQAYGIIQAFASAIQSGWDTNNAMQAADSTPLGTGRAEEANLPETVQNAEKSSNAKNT